MMRTELLTGMDLVTSIWGAIGVVIVFGALIFIVGVVAGLASSPQSVIDAGNAIGHLVGLS